MNSAVRRFLLFFFSIAALASCEDPTDIGIELQDDEQIGTDFTDTLTVNSGTVLLDDSVRSFKVSPALVGQYADPVLGLVSASTFTEVGLTTLNPSFGENPVADSLVLSLDYSIIYGSQNSDLTVSVHRLAEGFDERTSYFTNSELAYESAPVGAVTFRPQILTVKRNNQDADSAVLAKVRLDKALADALVALSGQEPLKTQEGFRNYFRGLALVPSGTVPGSIIGLNMASANTRLTLYYTSGTEKKEYTFTINTAGAFFTHVESDRTGTPVAELDTKGEYLPSSLTGGESYIQANTQLLTKLTFPYLDQLKELQGNIIINRAELIVPVKASSTSELAPPPQLVLYQTNSTNFISKNASGTPLAVQQDGSNVNSTFFPAALAYNAAKNQYSLNMTNYVQAMLLGDKPNTGLLLAPARIVPVQENNTFEIAPETRPYRAIISNTETGKIKLLLYYSKLN